MSLNAENEGIWTGVYRPDPVNFPDTYNCAALNINHGWVSEAQMYSDTSDQFTSFKQDYTSFVSGYPVKTDQNSNPTRDVILGYNDNGQMRDVYWDTDPSNRWTGWTVCEMNCKLEPNWVNPKADTHDDVDAEPDCSGSRKRRATTNESSSAEKLSILMDYSDHHYVDMSPEKEDVKKSYDYDDYDVETVEIHLEESSAIDQDRSKRDASNNWDGCTFPDIETSGAFMEWTHDCGGNKMNTNGGLVKWYRPAVPFYGKEESIYHMPFLTHNKQDAFQYCQNLGLDAVIMWCPKSDDEKNFLWAHHPFQQARNLISTSIQDEGFWTGIYRNDDDQTYSCAALDLDKTTVSNSELYDELTTHNYFDWAENFPTSNPNRDVFIGFDDSKMHDVDWSANNGQTQGLIICEMNCELYVEPTTPQEMILLGQ